MATKSAKKLKMVATGDYLPDRRLPRDADYEDLKAVLHKSDARITNFETTVSYQEGTPAVFCGGSPIFTTPDRLEDVKDLGFNLLASANNHALDYSVDGMIATMDYFREYGLNFAGIGMNKAEAAKPAYLDTENGRVALISICSSSMKTWYPIEQRRDFVGGPGVNSLSCYNDIRLTDEQFEMMDEIRKTTGLNNLADMMVDQGFVKMPEGMMHFGFDLYCFPLLFRKMFPGEEAGMTTYPGNVPPGFGANAQMDQFKIDIENAKLGADAVVINLHGHEMKGSDISAPADFHSMAAKAWIDAGADAVVIEGCHQTRGIEIYNGKPIFYSLGNFIFHDTLQAMPQNFYDDMGAASPRDQYNIVAQEAAAENEQYLTSNPDVLTSIFADWEMDEDGKVTAVTVYPIDLHVEKKFHHRGTPTLTDREDILDRVIKLSEPYGTKFEKETRTSENGKKYVVAKVLL